MTIIPYMRTWLLGPRVLAEDRSRRKFIESRRAEAYNPQETGPNRNSHSERQSGDCFFTANHHSFAEGESDVKLLATVSSIFICLALTSATPKQDNLAKKFVGAWRLVAVEGSFPIPNIDFDHPTGLIIYDQSGWMGVQIALKGTPKPFANGSSSGTVEE